MTFHYPDVSHYSWPVSLAGQDFAWIKATEGVDYVDPHYADFRADATLNMIPYGAYHYLRPGNLSLQALHATYVAGPLVPIMIDVEWTGEGAPLSVADILAFTDACRMAGGRPVAVYLPRWYWSDHMHTPDLRPLTQNGLRLISSDYGRPYSDAGRGFEPYGGVIPWVWQYTSNGLLAGKNVDFNGYPGSKAQFLADIKASMGATVSIREDPDAWTQAWRMQGVVSGHTTVQGGPTAGEEVWPVVELQAIRQNISALRDDVAKMAVLLATLAPGGSPEALKHAVAGELDAALTAALKAVDDIPPMDT